MTFDIHRSYCIYAVILRSFGRTSLLFTVYTVLLWQQSDLNCWRQMTSHTGIYTHGKLGVNNKPDSVFFFYFWRSLALDNMVILFYYAINPIAYWPHFKKSTYLFGDAVVVDVSLKVTIGVWKNEVSENKQTEGAKNEQLSFHYIKKSRNYKTQIQICVICFTQCSISSPNPGDNTFLVCISWLSAVNYAVHSIRTIWREKC